MLDDYDVVDWVVFVVVVWMKGVWWYFVFLLVEWVVVVLV